MISETRISHLNTLVKNLFFRRFAVEGSSNNKNTEMYKKSSYKWTVVKYLPYITKRYPLKHEMIYFDLVVKLKMPRTNPHEKARRSSAGDVSKRASLICKRIEWAR